MSAESKKIEAHMDRYLQCMKDQGKTPGSIAVTKKQFDALKDAYKKTQSGDLLKDAPFPAEHNGIAIEIYHDY